MKFISFILILLSLFLLYFFILKPKSFEYSIIANYEKHCHLQTKCIISLKEAVSFPWDKAYFFPIRTNQKDIEKVIHHSIDYNSALSTAIIFMKKDKIVYYYGIDINDRDLKLSLFSESNHVDIIFDKDSFDFNMVKDRARREIGYYLVTPDNDHLKIRRGISKDGFAKGYAVYPTNQKQVF